MARSQINSSRLQGGLGRREVNTDGVSAMVMNAVAVVSGLQLNTVYELNGMSDVANLLITPAYDDANDVLVYHHLERFFGRNPNGKLYLLCVSQTVTLEGMVDVANNFAKKVSKDKQGEVKLMGIIRNPLANYTPTLEDGLDADVWAAIPKAQALINEEAGNKRYFSIIIEGRSFNGTTASAENLRNLGDYPGVSVVIAADNDVSTAKAENAGYAAVGDFLGMLSKAAISQHPGEPLPLFNLSDAARGWFLKPGLSSALPLTSYSDTDLSTLDTKGYIFAETIPQVSGVYFQDTHTCAAISSDYAYIENNRVIDKMLRLANAALVRKAKSRFRVDPDTGRMESSVAAGLEDLVVNAVAGMQVDGDLSGGIDAFLDTNVDLLAGDSIDIELTAIPLVIGRAITLKVGFSNPLNQ